VAGNCKVAIRIGCLPCITRQADASSHVFTLKQYVECGGGNYGTDTHLESFLQLIHLGLEERNDLIACLLTVGNVDATGRSRGDVDHALEHRVFKRSNRLQKKREHNADERVELAIHTWSVSISH